MQKPNPPKTEAELLARAQRIAGLSLGEIAQQYGIAVPSNLNKEKGWVGLLLEHALGASAGSKPEPDFTELGIELKSIPINQQAKPLETTFVCVAPLTGLVGNTWQNSHLKHKLTKVLWVPVIAEREIPVAERIVCTAFLWRPSDYEEQLMAQDWQELTDMIVLGEVEKINGKHGQVLQLRPKAANSSAKTKAYDYEGKPFMTLPRGFYLKTAFTQYLINQHLRVI
ncbi:DNA mismatch repair endonuclease MutH [Thalassotalea sp. 1_MG-2023]|uniref:DNA mismatch repair endonuclease MutH n=1 Tax=Thalassotalea sp. 1_MG-2023 TaxID=3062680 RepID=UPI0026E26BAA|nr:DNA mismatch repair endonuclease MutH [Thalassotalea sp. 1_MG-2023]MDO6426397.1 DNA mismatch repair endonuclease MutH [Thalassotalea sp. 1_MG-2023]